MQNQVGKPFCVFAQFITKHGKTSNLLQLNLNPILIELISTTNESILLKNILFTKDERNYLNNLQKVIEKYPFGIKKHIENYIDNQQNILSNNQKTKGNTQFIEKIVHDILSEK